MANSVFNLSDLNGVNGFAINGIAAGDGSGFSVSSAGDVNGDGFDDLIIGALSADPNGSLSGQSYVVFGSSSGFSPTLNLSTLNGANGFAINGIAASNQSGFSVSSAGDINGDGFDDLIIGAPSADPNGPGSGQSYVVFGSSSGFSPTLNLSTLNGANGFAINGIAVYDSSGCSVSSAGDINGDGFDDLIIGAPSADPNGSSSGRSYVVFGSSSGFSPTLNLSTLNGANGFAINGIAAGDNSGFSVSSAGDVNSDGLDDLIIGAPLASPNGSSSGQSYVVFGSSSGFSPTLNLSTLNGVNGFAINGIAAGEGSGSSVSSAGDVNVDGFDDLIIGARYPSPNRFRPGQSYVVFGSSSGFSPTLNLSTLNGANGFAINGIADGDYSGSSVSSAGDVNGDGFDDLIIGAPFVSLNSFQSGQSYVVFGSNSGFSATLNLFTLDGANGFAINGIAASNHSGYSVSSAGDINGDSLDDLIIGAPSADPNRSGSGQSYVVFGNRAPVLDLNGLGGFVINGIAEGDKSGSSVSSAGDINGDGFDDLIIGARYASPNRFRPGQSYVVFGSSSGFSPTLNLSTLNGANGFAINGIADGDYSASSVSSAGDVNGDGFDDLIIGAPFASASLKGFRSGKSYVVFGSSSGFSPTFNLSTLNGANGFVINGIAEGDFSGSSVSSAGDVNGDGFDDLIIGARFADPNGSYSGQSYVVFGSSSGFSPTLNLSTLNGVSGFAINGIAEGDISGFSVSSAGDVNGDGFDDLIIGAFGADPNGPGSGQSYVVFGKSSGFSPTLNLSTLNGANGFAINGIAQNDYSGRSVSSAGDVNGDGFDDLIIGAPGDFRNGNGSFSGQSYVVFGSSSGFSPTLNLSTLNGANGFAINGIAEGDRSGYSVSSAGDVNGDGFDDLIIGAFNASYSGQSYVVFGSSGGFNPTLNLSSLNGANGFAINAIPGSDYSGFSVSSAGDVNGDGFDDLIIGAPGDFLNGSELGQSYVVFGEANIGAGGSINLAQLLDSNFNFVGIDFSTTFTGTPVSIVDSDFTLTDNKATLAGATITITNLLDGTSESLAATAIGNITATYNATTGILTLSGIDTIANYRQVLASLTYNNTDASPNATNRVIEFVVDDGQPFSNTSSVARTTVAVSPSPNQPPVAVNDAFSTNENRVFSGNVLIANPTTPDSDPDNDTLTVTQVNGNAAAVGNSITLTSGAILTLNSNGSFVYNPQGQFESLSVGATASDSFTYTINDGNGGISTATVNLTIKGGNRAPVLDLDLDKLGGFVINGIEGFDSLGSSVSSAGDINGDGFDDLIIGAPNASPNGSQSGQTYVVFGRSSGFSPILNPSSLNGANGFAINGIAERDFSGSSVSSAGDVNGDGFDDLIIGAPNASPNGSYSGQSYVVFGSSSGFSSTLNLSTLNGANGFAINGIAEGDYSGKSVSSAGDVNGDGFDDLIIGAPNADPNGSFSSGQSYVVFGSSSGFSSTFNLSTLNGANGFAINGIAAGDFLGESISNAGDVNGDGFDDLIIGAFLADPNGTYSGQSYVVFGSNSGFSSTLNLSTLNGANGFAINGITAYDGSGYSVSNAGDINGDGFDDLIIGASGADPNGFLSGQSYVVFGSSSGFSPTLNLSTLNGANGFAINRFAAYDQSGSSVSSAGDVNGDGFDDVIIGAFLADPNGSGSGRSYVVFGSSSGFSPTLYAANGFAINGIAAGDYSGKSVSSAGDINGDGFDDLIIGAPNADPNGSQSGQSYVVFGDANIGTGGRSDFLGIDFSTTFTGSPVSIVDSDFTLTDNNATLAGATITITNLLDGTAESLGATAIGNITATYDATTGILTLSGIDTIANYRQVLASLTYNNTDASPNTTNRIIEFVVDDGQPFNNTSAVATTTVAVSPSLNQPPVAVNDAFSTNENRVFSGNVLVANPSTPDSDPNDDVFTVTQVNGNAAAVGNSVTLTSGAILTLNSNGSFVYNPNGQFESLGVGATASDSFAYTISDRNGGTSTATVNVTINGFGPTLNLSTLNGVNGFAINGITEGDFSGNSVSSAGDVNGDGFDDLIIGARSADPNGSFSSGQSYVVFGSSSGFSPTLNLSTLNGVNGFAINGIAGNDYSGSSVSNAGDVNGDGFDDLIIGAPGTSLLGPGSGRSYVVFGSSSGFSPTLNLSTLNGANGFAIKGIASGDNSGRSVSSAGDVNGDGFDDLIIGAQGADPNGSRSGQSYVVFGKSSGFSPTLNLSTLNGANGFAINGIAAGDNSGRSVSSAGDVNGDGFDDLIIGAIGANPNGYSSGQSYVVFGKSSGFSPTLNLSTLNGANGFAINGIAQDDFSGYSVSSAGDINGDGFDDLIIGARSANPNGSSSGQSYLVFGKSTGFSPTFNLSTLDGANGFAINGIAAYDSSGSSVSSAGDVNGDGFDDLIIGARSANPNGSSSGQSYLVFGSSSFSPTFNLSTLDGANGFAIDGIAAYDSSGSSVSGAGDVNGDGFDDLIIGAPNADPNGSSSGQSYVVFGKRAPVVDLNQPPIAINDAFTTNEDTVFNGNVLIANPTTPDSDPNNDTLTVTQVNGNAAAVGNSITLTNGALLTLNSNGSFVYNPNGQFESLGVGATASDSFAYTISDRKGGISTATVNLTINGVNDAPTLVIALPDQATTENSAFNFTFPTNTFADIDVGDTLTYTATLDNGNPLPSWLSFNANTRTFSGTPAAGNVGTISVKVIAKDTSNANVSDIFKLTVTPLSLTGTQNADSLAGTASNNTINGLAGNDIISGNQGDDTLIGGGGKDRFVFNLGDGTDTITDLDGMGKGSDPQPAVIAKIDILKFQGAGLTARNLLLTKNGSNLEVSFENVVNSPKVILQNFALENLDNLTGIGNIIFDGQTTIIDSFDVFDADSTLTSVFNRDTVTFLNDLNNNVSGFNSADVINGQLGDDSIDGLNGDDLLRGGAGNDSLVGDNGDDLLYGDDGNDSLFGGNGQDLLVGGAGNDFLNGGKGDDNLTGGTGSDIFVLATAAGRDTITDFSLGQSDKIGLSGLSFNQLSFSGNEIRLGNQTLAVLTGFDTTTLTQSNFFLV